MKQQMVLLFILTGLLFVLSFWSIIASNFSKQQETYSLYLPGSRLWMNSGIYVSKGEQVDFLISGGVNTAINRIVFHNIELSKTPFPWSHLPSDRTTETERQSTRDETLVSGPQTGWYRDILLCIIKDDTEFTLLNDDPLYAANNKKIIPLRPTDGNWLKSKISIEAPESGFICLVVNDNYIKEEEAFIYTDIVRKQKIENYDKINDYVRRRILSNLGEIQVDSAAQEQYGDPYGIDFARFFFRYKLNPPQSESNLLDWEVDKWNNLVNKNYYRIFYDDNIGGFLINISI